MDNALFCEEKLKNSSIKARQISAILLNEWDPIGIKNIPEAKDEYDSYIPSIYNLVISQKSEEEIFHYLWWIETEYMGLCGDKQQTKIIARKLSLLATSL